MAEGKVMMFTDEEEKEFERLKSIISANHRNKYPAIGELLVLLKILQPYEARRIG